MPTKTVNPRIAWAQWLTDKCLILLESLCEISLRSYQLEMADRIFFSLIFGDADEITVEATRQGGKTETISCVVSTAMVILPQLAKMFPTDEVLQKFKYGVMIGLFAPIDFQADTLFSRIEMHLTSEHAKQFLADPEIDDEAHPNGNLIQMRHNHSFCRKQTAFPKAKIESTTYHLIIIDEAQDADSETVRRRIHPMMTAVSGTIVKIGTPTTHTSDFLEAIQRNKRRSPSNGKKNHFAYDWRRAAKESKFYAQAIKKEKERLGEDSDEFQMSYCLKWLLDRGMFVTEDIIEELSDYDMMTVPYYTESPIVIGIDVAAKHDSTVCTAIWVDWEHPDEFGLFNHRILNWLELHGENWESQYRQICEFVSRYYVMRIAVDAQGMGGPVAERLQTLLPSIEVVACAMNPIDQSERWQHLMQLIQRKLLGWPAHPRTQRLMTHQRFIQQILNVEKEYKGRYLLVGAPKNEKNAHDDYLDSLALACWMTKEFGQGGEVEVWNSNPFYERSGVGRR